MIDTSCIENAKVEWSRRLWQVTESMKRQDDQERTSEISVIRLSPFFDTFDLHRQPAVTRRTPAISHFTSHLT